MAQTPEDWPVLADLRSPTPSPPSSPHKDEGIGSVENVRKEAKDDDVEADDIEILYMGGIRNHYADPQPQPPPLTSNLQRHPSDRQINNTSAIPYSHPNHPRISQGIDSARSSIEVDSSAVNFSPQPVTGTPASAASSRTSIEPSRTQTENTFHQPPSSQHKGKVIRKPFAASHLPRNLIARPAPNSAPHLASPSLVDRGHVYGSSHNSRTNYGVEVAQGYHSQLNSRILPNHGPKFIDQVSNLYRPLPSFPVNQQVGPPVIPSLYHQQKPSFQRSQLPAPPPNHHHHRTVKIPPVVPGSPASLWTKTPTLRDLLQSDTYQCLTPEQRKKVIDLTSDKFWYQPVAPPLQHQVQSLYHSAESREAPQCPATFFPKLPHGNDLASLDLLSQILLKLHTTNTTIPGEQRLPIPNGVAQHSGFPKDFNQQNLRSQVQGNQIQVSFGNSNLNRQVDSTNTINSTFHETFSQAARMPPLIDQGSFPTEQPANNAVDSLKIHGKQTCMVSRPSVGAPGSVGPSNFRKDPGCHQRPNDTSMMVQQDPSGPPALDQFKQKGYGTNQSHSHPSLGPKFVPNMSSQPRPSPAQQPSSLSHVSAIASNPALSWGNSHLDRMVNSSSPNTLQPSVSGHSDRRLSSSPFTISNDGVALVASSENPSRLAVVLSPDRTFSTSTPSKLQHMPRDPPLQYASPRGLFTSLKARVEIPASTPERLALKSYIPQPHPSAKKRGRPFASLEAAEVAMAKAVRKVARENGHYVDEKKKKPGRPAKSSKHIEIPVPEPKYAVFFCEWKGCPAELHNAQTLRLHLHVVHGKKDPITKKITCQWKDCIKINHTEDVVTGDINETREDFVFGSKEEWKKHLEDSHLLRVLWYQGDGPKVQHHSKFLPFGRLPPRLLTQARCQSRQKKPARNRSMALRCKRETGYPLRWRYPKGRLWQPQGDERQALQEEEGGHVNCLRFDRGSKCV